MARISAGDRKTHELIMLLIAEVQKLVAQLEPAVPVDADEPAVEEPDADPFIAPIQPAGRKPAAPAWIARAKERAREIEADYNSPLRVNGRAMAACIRGDL